MRATKIGLTIRLDPILHRQAEYVCFKKRTTFQKICVTAIKQQVALVKGEPQCPQ